MVSLIVLIAFVIANRHQDLLEPAKHWRYENWSALLSQQNIEDVTTGRPSWTSRRLGMWQLEYILELAEHWGCDNWKTLGNQLMIEDVTTEVPSRTSRTLRVWQMEYPFEPAEHWGCDTWRILLNQQKIEGVTSGVERAVWVRAKMCYKH